MPISNRLGRLSRGTRTGLAAGATAAAVLTAGLVGYTAYADADFQIGATYTDGGVPWGDDAAMESAAGILGDVTPMQNQHIIGFGADELWPSPEADRDWSSLDERIEWIKSTGGTPVITLCSAPGWMKPSGDTWEMNEAPMPEYYDEYAQLSAEVAERYGDDVAYYQVWNEFKGFWKGSDLDYAGYTDFYNQVYDAVKAADPDAKLGGPYVSLRTAINGSAERPSDLKGDWGEVDGQDLEAIEYWMDNKNGADFFTVDGWSIDKDGNALDVDGIQAMYTDIAEWMVAHADGLPVWWSEFYAPLSGTPENPGESSPEAMTAALTGMRDGGASVALWWDPEADAGDNLPGLYTSTESAGGGQRTEYTEVAEQF